MPICTSNVHYMFYPSNDPLPISEFQSLKSPGKLCKHCLKCRNYRTQMRLKDKTRVYERRSYSPCDDACFHCIQKDCIREDSHDLPQHDGKYLNRCMLAVSRRFKVNPLDIPHNGKIIKWKRLKI